MTPAQRQAFLNLCSQANTSVDLAERKFSAWLSSVTVAYAQAWTRHTSVLRDAELSARLTNDLVLSAALAFLPGGAAGMIGDTMRRLGSGAFMVDAVKDLNKWGMRSGAMVGVGGTLSFGRIPALQAFPTDPLVWSHNVNQRVQTELAVATAAIEGWQDAVNRNNPNFEPNFNPVDKVNEALRLRPAGTASRPLMQLVPENVPTLQTQYETGFLTGWVDAHAANAFMSMSQAAWGGVFSDGVRDKLINYGKSIGLADIETRLNAAVSRGVQENNRRAIASGHGLI
jgi:hypothetical protein